MKTYYLVMGLKKPYAGYKGRRVGSTCLGVVNEGRTLCGTGQNAIYEKTLKKLNLTDNDIVYYQIHEVSKGYAYENCGIAGNPNILNLVDDYRGTVMGKCKLFYMDWNHVIAPIKEIIEMGQNLQSKKNEQLSKIYA